MARFTSDIGRELVVGIPSKGTGEDLVVARVEGITSSETASPKTSWGTVVTVCRGRPVRWVPFVLTCATLWGGCESPSSGPQILTSDSAGVTVIRVPESYRPSQGYAVGSDPLWIKAEFDPNAPFVNIVGIVPTDAGAWVVDGGLGRIGRVSRAGEWLDVRGRRGRGPGEYAAIGSTSGADDGGVAIFDQVARRVTTIPGNEGRETTQPVVAPALGGAPADGCVSPSGEFATAHGAVLYWGWRCLDEDRGTSLAWYRGDLYLGSEFGEGTWDNLGSFPTVEVVATSDGVDFSPAPRVALTQPTNAGLALCVPDDASLHIWTLAGEQVIVIREEAVGQPLTADERSVLRTQWELTPADEAKLDIPWNACGSLFFSDDGTVWVASVPRPLADSTRWVGFDERSGLPTHELAVHRDLRLLAIQGDVMYGVMADSFGVQRVAAFRLRNDRGDGS